MFLWDVVRNRRIHRAYWVWLAVGLPFTVAVHALWDTSFWHAMAKIIINPSGSKPGYITVDSNATGNLCSQNNTWALDALGTQN